MHICYLADAGSVHTQRWTTAFSMKGYQVTLLSLREAQIRGAEVIPLSPPRYLEKLGYLTVIPKVRALVHKLKPDILHAHYSTSYGLLGAHCNYHPFILSVWGTDVYDFPKRSFFHKQLLKYNLRLADIVCSTSHVMAKESATYTNKQIQVIPFGVDTTSFTSRLSESSENRKCLTIGIVKTLESKYGVHTLIKAFILLANQYPHIRLLIVGDGSQKVNLIQMVDHANLKHRVQFAGAISHSEVPNYLKQMDIFVVPSQFESFGVAAIEASACGLPVVASRVGGLLETVIDGETGLLVPPEDETYLAKALSTLIESPMLRHQLGQKGRSFVESNYSWSSCVSRMEHIYNICK